MKYENQELVEQVDKVANEILSQKHSNHHRDHFFPALIDKLNLKIGVEVGVDKGEFSAHLLGKSKLEKLYCVDTWQDDFGSNYKPGFYDPNGNNRYIEAATNLKEFAERIILAKGTSVEMANQFSNALPGKEVDFCYIDGDHTYEGVYVDIRAWLPKLKIGGILAGHDYKYKEDAKNSGIKAIDGDQLDYGVKIVVDGFCKRYGYPLRVVGGRILSWFFVKNREAEDPLNVYNLRS